MPSKPQPPKPLARPEPTPDPAPLDGHVAPRPREPGAHPRCVFCHADALVAALRCDDCGAIVHADCARGLETCPTLGCARSAAELGPVRTQVARRARRPMRTLALTILLALGLGAALLQTQSYLLSEERRDAAWAQRHAEDALELARGLRDPRPEVQHRAFAALRALGPAAQPAGPELAGVVRNQEEMVLAAAELLATLDPDRASALFTELLSGPGRERRFFSLYRACALLDGRPALTDALALLRGRPHVQPYPLAFALARLKPELAAELLLEAFHQAPTDEAQREVTQQLTWVADAGGAAAVTPVRRALERIADQAHAPTVRQAAQARLDALEASR